MWGIVVITYIVLVLGVCLEGDLTATSCTADVESCYVLVSYEKTSNYTFV